MSVCVQAAQAALLGAASAQQLAVERMVYANMAAQADADARAKVGGSRLDWQVCGSVGQGDRVWPVLKKIIVSIFYRLL